MESYLDDIKAFSRTVGKSFENAFIWPTEADSGQTSTVDRKLQESTNMKPTSLENEIHILTTTELNPVISNHFEPKHAAGVVTEEQMEEPVERPEDVDLDISWSTHTNTRSSDIDVPMLMASCRHFADMARGTQGYMKDWNDVHRAAAVLRPVVGISEDAWKVVNKV